jgi:CMP-2-keto-3-deoxyoctulosonic acid synthetase
MPTYVIRNGELVDKREAEPLVMADSAHYVISDTMSETRHMATGKYHTSKAKFRADTKASGCVEIGNDSSLYKPRKPIPLSREKRRDDIRRTIYEMRNGIKRNGDQ